MEEQGNPRCFIGKRLVVIGLEAPTIPAPPKNYMDAGKIALWMTNEPENP